MTIFVKKGARPFYEGRLCAPHRYPDLAIRGAVIADSAKRNHAEAVVCCMSSGNGPSLGKIAHVPAAASSVASPSPHLRGGRRRGDADKMREHALFALEIGVGIP